MLGETLENTIEMNTLNEIAEEVHALAKRNGFHPESEDIRVFMANQCNNITGEVSELWESWRKGTQWQPCDKACQLNQTEEELADIIIRALDLSRRLGIDIQRAVEEKHNYNKTRPYKHGKLN